MGTVSLGVAVEGSAEGADPMHANALAPDGGKGLAGGVQAYQCLGARWRLGLQMVLVVKVERDILLSCALNAPFL